MQDLHTLIETSVTQLGFALVDLEISNRGKMLRVFIDKAKPENIKDSVNIDDCALVSHQLCNLLALEHEIDYDRLEVSSPGIDRVLKKAEDFTRFVNERATVKLRVAFIEQKEGKDVVKKNLVGLIRGIENDQLLLELDGMVHQIALSNIDKSRLNPEF